MGGTKIDVGTHKLIHMDELRTILTPLGTRDHSVTKQLGKQMRISLWSDEWCAGQWCTLGTGIMDAVEVRDCEVVSMFPESCPLNNDEAENGR